MVMRDAVGERSLNLDMTTRAHRPIDATISRWDKSPEGAVYIGAGTYTCTILADGLLNASCTAHNLSINAPMAGDDMLHFAEKRL